MASIIGSIFTALGGAQAAVRRQQVGANNLANISTTGFHAKRPVQSGGPVAGGPPEVMATSGGRRAQGPILFTGQSLDLAISGAGYLAFRTGPEETVYSRSGALSVNSEGVLVNSQGLPLEPPIQLFETQNSFQIDSDGSVHEVDQRGRTRSLGRIQLAQFANPDGLAAQGQNLFSATKASGPPAFGLPGLSGRGRIVPGALEGSDVDLSTEIINQTLSLRSLQANLNVIKQADETADETLDILRQGKGSNSG